MRNRMASVCKCCGMACHPKLGEAERRMAGSTGLEPAASGVTGRRSNQLNYDPAKTSNPTTWAPSRQYETVSTPPRPAPACYLRRLPTFPPWAVSSVGRAPVLHTGCHRFESCTAHQPSLTLARDPVSFGWQATRRLSAVAQVSLARRWTSALAKGQRELRLASHAKVVRRSASIASAKVDLRPCQRPA
jgi:hypothetical protein